MLTIIYSELGTPINDFKVDEWFYSLDPNSTHEVSSEIAINRVRLGIVSGNIDYREVTFKYRIQSFREKGGTLINLEHDRKAEFKEYPLGFLDKFSSILLELI